MTTTVLDHIGVLVTNDVAIAANTGDGVLGTLTDAYVVFDGASIVDAGTGAPPAADRRIDAGGRCVLPGFVDSHTHLVFAGDRSSEFASRMAGRPYEAGGINVTVGATRAASDATLRSLAVARRDEGRRAGITTTEIKSGYGLTAVDEARCLRIAGELTGETTFLGAHVVPPEYIDRADAYIDYLCDAANEFFPNSW